MSNSTILTGSVTQAMKAKKILTEHSIVAEVRKLSSSQGRKGCLYGLIFSSDHFGNVSRILSIAGIPFEEYRE